MRNDEIQRNNTVTQAPSTASKVYQGDTPVVDLVNYKSRPSSRRKALKNKLLRILTSTIRILYFVSSLTYFRKEICAYLPVAAGLPAGGDGHTRRYVKSNENKPYESFE